MTPERGNDTCNAVTLRDAAARHLSRFAATERGLTDVLERRVRRWAERARAKGVDDDTVQSELVELLKAVRVIVADMVRCGAVNDRSFSASRAKSLLRTGHSRRHMTAWLQSRGVASNDIALGLNEALGDGHEQSERELAAAYVFARKKRIGPFSTQSDNATTDPRASRQRVLAAFARAGFTQDVAIKVLESSEQEATDVIFALKQL